MNQTIRLELSRKEAVGIVKLIRTDLSPLRQDRIWLTFLSERVVRKLEPMTQAEMEEVYGKDSSEVGPTTG